MDTMSIRAAAPAAEVVGSPGASEAAPRDPKTGIARADVALSRLLRWTAPAAAAVAVLAAASGAAFLHRPSALGAVAALGTLVLTPLLVGALARRLQERLEVAITGREVFRGELAAVWPTADLDDSADHDDLTGLPTRGALYDRLALAIVQSHRQAQQFALVLLDVDDFKRVNERFGHGAGDRVLVELASRVRTSVRARDTVSRFGGDEFAVLLDGVGGARDAAGVAAELLESVQAPCRLDGEEISLAASVGVSVYPADGTSAAELVGSAREAQDRYKDRPADTRG